MQAKTTILSVHAVKVLDISPFKGRFIYYFHR